jgi:peptidoglycan-associated lipoprotein
MRQEFRKSLILCLAAVLCCAGCAKQEIVKQDQMIPAVGTANTGLSTKSVVPDVAQATPKETVMATPSISEEQAAGQAAKNGTKGKAGSVQAGLNKVYFDFDSRTLSAEARATLAKNAEILKQLGSAKIRIEGNCDDLGSDDYNLSLGESRAKSAMSYLLSLGIQADRLSVVSYGKEKPADPGHDDAARAKNRRDEFVISAR